MARFVLLVEDDPVLGPSLEQRLMLEGFAVRLVDTLQGAREVLSTRAPDFVLSDIRLPDGSGADLLDDLSARLGSVPLMFMTAFGDLDQAVDLVRRGARDYLSKPFDLDTLVARLRDLTDPSRSAILDDPFATFGLSAATARLRSTLERLADVDLPVLVFGETGTGKEVAARYLHAAGNRADKPFEAINCGQVSADLADSLLFGHERGAFTGAMERRAGVMETVGEGTLLLDEIGETSHDLQLKLLRVLQERRFRRLGALVDQPFQGRVVCATHRDLEEAVAGGSFREDLWFRLNVVTLRMPPLRDRPEEIVPLSRTFLAEAGGRLGRPDAALTPDALAAAQAYDWPGNIRELRNRIERAVALADVPQLGVDEIFPGEGRVLQARQSGSMPRAEDGFATLAEARDAAERTHIVRVLEACRGRMMETADILGVSRSTLWERMRRLGIERPETDRPGGDGGGKGV